MSGHKHTATEILALPMEKNDAGAETIGEYLILLLSEVWERGECFSGKRPFGNSGWEYDLYIPLMRHGVIGGTIDEDGNVESCDKVAGYDVIQNAITRCNTLLAPNPNDKEPTQ